MDMEDRMDTRLLHTPEGVRDYYNEDCISKQELLKRIHTVQRSFGYHDIQTPTFEFFDIFSREVGTTQSKDLYKFFDREGNTLVLRPDFTPSIARCAAKYFLEDAHPVRLCYSGSTFINESAAYRGRLKETTQIGVEFIGDAAVTADAEILALAVESLLASGLTKFQVEVGQVEFFKGLLEEAGLSDDEGEQLRQRISEKNFFGVDELLEKKDLSDGQRRMFQKLTQTFGGIELIEEAKSWTKNMRAIQAIERLEAIYACLKEYGCEQYISFDLGMLSKYQYYTGIIFRAYTYGTGEAIVTGGRYDSLMHYFGKEAPAVGFVVLADQLMNALNRQNISMSAAEPETVVLYDDGDFQRALQTAGNLRREGICVELIRRTSLDDERYYQTLGRKLVVIGKDNT